MRERSPTLAQDFVAALREGHCPFADKCLVHQESLSYGPDGGGEVDVTLLHDRCVAAMKKVMVPCEKLLGGRLQLLLSQRSIEEEIEDIRGNPEIPSHMRLLVEPVGSHDFGNAA